MSKFKIISEVAAQIHAAAMEEKLEYNRHRLDHKREVRAAGGKQY